MKIDKKEVLTIITSYLGDGIDGQTLVSLTKHINLLPTTVDEWVSVSDVVKPKLGTDVIVLDSHLDCYIVDYIGVSSFKYCTHWMPLPTPPTP